MIVKGQKINDRYQIIRLIGEGGMANVYLAYDPILDRNVAVKILRGDLATDEKFVRRFQREAISASSLDHPNIVEMYDVGEDEGNYFIVMEYIDGKTLKNLIKRRGKLTLPEVIDIMLQLTSAISCAHDSYIIHRDIKPQNVIILDDGRVKITDFGIAIASNASELTQTNSVMGSVHYLPPEQANGKGATIKSDIYSLGILMYELLTGKVPFKGENAVEIALKQLREPIPSVCEDNIEIPQSIENVILKACAKNTKNRYDSAREMYMDIKTALDPERLTEKKLVYRYDESDLEETKTLTDLAEIANMTREEKQKEKTELDEIEEKEEKQSKKMNVVLWILGGLVALIAIITCVVLFLIPSLQKTKNVKIPDVAGLTVEKAEKELMDAGLTVAVELKEESSDTVKEGKIISTSPKALRTVKEKTEITLIVSTGTEKIKIEDYTKSDKTYLEVKGALETLGLKVTVEKKKVEETADLKYEADKIIEQSVKAGESLAKGASIILYIPDVIIKYPDFTTNYTLAQVEEWCKTNKVNLVKTELSTTDYKVGNIIYQSREADSQVIENATLKITIVVAPQTDEVTPDTKTQGTTTEGTTKTN
ncbi:MAG TPA: Stk1 family PASTA domain-containing Ser/Thr kinase [Bacilli bacterium]|nr:Stk1 family PASTA domain-containing Ser/Thr kinase [Bacilli bacterium]